MLCVACVLATLLAAKLAGYNAGQAAGLFSGACTISAALGVVSGILGLLPCLGDIVRCLLMPVWILGILVSLGAAIFEIVKIVQDPEGIRMGDQMAGTKVVR